MWSSYEGASLILLKKKKPKKRKHLSRNAALAGDLKSVKNRSYVRHVCGYCFRGGKGLELKALGRLLRECVCVCVWDDGRGVQGGLLGSGSDQVLLGQQLEDQEKVGLSVRVCVCV